MSSIMNNRVQYKANKLATTGEIKVEETLTPVTTFARCRPRQRQAVGGRHQHHPRWAILQHAFASLAVPICAGTTHTPFAGSPPIRPAEQGIT
jgi:hypothetical protein